MNVSLVQIYDPTFELDYGRWHSDGFGDIWPRGEGYENAELGNVADRIRDAYSDG